MLTFNLIRRSLLVGEKTKNIIISPSGQLYGSENVLFDFLESSDRQYKIYAPKKSLFYEKLKAEGYDVLGFRSLKVLYLSVFLQLLFFKKSLLVNEGGHINYVNLLANLMPGRKFVIIVRLLEDCNVRFKSKPKNLTVVAISKFIKKHLDSYTKALLVYDPYCLTPQSENLETSDKLIKKSQINIGIVGRVTETKGGNLLLELISKLDMDSLALIRFYFYGHYSKNDKWFAAFQKQLEKYDISYYLFGFIKEKNIIYENIDLLLHFNEREALGRIIFEAVDYNKPFLCLKKGGTGELATALDLEGNVVEDVSEMAQKLGVFLREKQVPEPNYQDSKHIINTKFSARLYVESIEQLL